MPVFTPGSTLELAPIPMVDGVQISPPLTWVSAAEIWNTESGTSVTGRYNEATGEIVGPCEIKAQDTFISGTASRTGRAFSVVSGTWASDWVNPNFGTYGVMHTNGATGQLFEIIDVLAGSPTGLKHNEVVIRRGIPGIGTARTAAENYLYLELANGDSKGNYRVAMVFGQPIRLDYQAAGSTTWQEGVAVARALGDFETYMAQNNGEIRLQITPDNYRNVMIVEIGSGHFLRHTPPRPTLSERNVNATGSLPTAERYRLQGKNGWCQFQVFPMRYKPVVVRKSPRKRATQENLSAAQFAINAAGRAAINAASQVQTTTPELTQTADGLEWTATGRMPDAGDGLGSEYPPTLADFTVNIPAVWGNIAGYYPNYTADPLVVDEIENYDDITQTITSHARVTINNKYGDFSGAFGNYAAALVATNGQRIGRRIRGILAGGITTHRQDPTRLAEFSIFDFSYKMGVPLGDDCIFDGWCLYSVIRFLHERGQVHPQYLRLIPDYPYGPARYDCPYPILGRGTGSYPKYRYPASRTCISIMLEMLQESGIVSPFSGSNVPFVYGFDDLGLARFQGFDPRFEPVVKGYSDQQGADYPIERITVYNSVEHLRTELNLQGQDAFTGELLYMHLPMPWNLQSVGYRYMHLERNERWCSPSYLETIGRSAALRDSIPQQTVFLQTRFDPLIHAGQLVYIEERRTLRRGGIFVILTLRNRYGLSDISQRRGQQVCESHLVCRSVESLIPY